MPAYPVDVAGFASGADPKWIDNLLARFPIDGVERATHGVARKVSTSGIRVIVLTRRLVTTLNLPIGTAVDLAGRMLTSANGCVAVHPGLEIRIDREAFFRDVEVALLDAAEQVVPARRGRPPRTAPTAGG